MSASRRLYADVAVEVRGLVELTTGSSNAAVVDDFVFALCRVFERDNPRFDSARFLTACGFDS